MPVDESRKGFPWWIIVIAAVTGVSAEEYMRRKNNKATNKNDSQK